MTLTRVVSGVSEMDVSKRMLVDVFECLEAHWECLPISAKQAEGSGLASWPRSPSPVGTCTFSFVLVSSLETINFSGNVETWNGIYGYKGNWDEGAAGFTVYCIDGEVKRPRE